MRFPHTGTVLTILGFLFLLSSNHAAAYTSETEMKPTNKSPSTRLSPLRKACAFVPLIHYMDLHRSKVPLRAF